MNFHAHGPQTSTKRPHPLLVIRPTTLRIPHLEDDAVLLYGVYATHDVTMDDRRHSQVRCWWCARFHDIAESTAIPRRDNAPWEMAGYFCDVACAKAFMAQNQMRVFPLKKISAKRTRYTTYHTTTDRTTVEIPHGIFTIERHITRRRISPHG